MVTKLCKTKFKKGDNVRVVEGKDIGKSGRILKIFRVENRAIVEGVNFVKRHKKPSQDDPKGGIVQKESPIHLSNLAIICPACEKQVRVGRRILDSGEKVRFCKSCKAILEK